MAERIEIGPCLGEFAKAIAQDTDVDLASIVLKDCLKRARVHEIAQVSVTKEVYGAHIYMRTNTGREVTADVPNAHGKFETIKYGLREFVKKYNKGFLQP